MSEKLEIICPECQKTNIANLKTELHCKYCKEELTDKIYIKKCKKCVPFFTSMIVGTILGGIGTVGGEIYLLKQSPASEKTIQNNISNRYSTNDEFLILENCIFADDRPLDRSQVDVKKDICICALEKTQRDNDLQIYGKNDPNFMYTFYENANECMSTKASTAAEPAAEVYPY